MRASRRLFAAVASNARYLEPNVPTGLTGISTHPSPRPALLYTYNVTLEKLKQLPASSVYRQSTEALTKHRMSIVEQVKPPGHAEWLARVQKQIAANPEDYKRYQLADGSIVASEYVIEDRPDVWDGEVTKKDALNQIATSEEDATQKAQKVRSEVEKVDAQEGQRPEVTLRMLEEEPRLTADQ